VIKICFFNNRLKVKKNYIEVADAAQYQRYKVNTIGKPVSISVGKTNQIQKSHRTDIYEL
jgi:hypothetical protein